MSATFWDKRARKYDDAIRKHGVGYDKTLARTQSLLSASDSVLDFGCASGEYSIDIARFVHHVYGIDTSAGMIALATRKARDRGLDNVAFDPVGLFDPSLEGQGHTRVLAFSILHLVSDLDATMNRIHELLPPAGLLISETPCLGEQGPLLRALITLAQKLRLVPPLRCLTLSELEGAVERAGFDIVESDAWDPKNAVYWLVARKR